MARDNAEESADDNDHEVELLWIPPERNPFGILLLDVRPLTQTAASWTKDPSIVEQYGAQRENNGLSLVVTAIDDAEVIECGLSFDLPRPTDEGPVFKAQCMEDKWDIYNYAGNLLFARSWTGQLIFRALIAPDADNLVITAIQSHKDYAQQAAQHVAFLVMSHLEGIPFPHMLPAVIPDDPSEMALASFHLFGRRALYATHEDILTMKINTDFCSDDPDTTA
jgi:hypothetical protein